MDKFEYKIKADEIKELIAQGEYEQAAEIADSIDWRRVKSVMMLCTVSDLYKICRRYEDSRDMLLLAYERHPGGRTILYSLCELSIKMEEFVQAVEYYKEFVQIAPKDSGRFILQYKLYEAQDVSLEERIAVLEELKKKDYREKWAYELAYLYHRVGLATKCVEECDELFLWFGDGKYVVKALELKKLHAPLTPEQQYKYDSRFENVQQGSAVESAADNVNGGENSAMQEVQAQPVQEEQTQNDVMSASTNVLPAEEIDIHVKTLEVGKYDTINLQEELAAGIQEYFGTSNDETAARSIVDSVLESETKVVSVRALKDMTEVQPAADVTVEQEPQSEVFFGETGEVELEETDLAQMQDKTVGQVVEETRILEAQPPKNMANVLSMEADGQISFVLPEKDPVEKQITGQISINDIILEWERLKKENEEKRKEDVRQRVLEQTGQMFTEFEASVRDGLLEQLESGQKQAESLDEQLAELFEEKQAETEIEEEAGIAGSAEMEETVEIVRDAEIEEVAELAEATEIVEAFVEEAEETVQNAAEISEEIPQTSEDSEEDADSDDFGEVEELTEIADVIDEVASDEEIVSEEEEVFVEEIEEIAETSAVPEEADEAAEENVEPEDIRAAELTEEEEKQAVEEAENSFEAENAEAIEQGAETAEADEAPTVKEVSGENQEPVREKRKVRNLTREERELYGQYIQGRSSKEQIIKAVDGISMASYTGNIIVTGDEGMDAIGLAKNMIREVQMTDSNFSGKIAKISGDTLNERDVKQIMDDLNNGALIIQKASRMNQETAGELYKLLQQEHRGIVIAMEDSRKAMDRFLAKNDKLLTCFTSRVDIAALSNDALVAFAKKYAREKEYSIDQMGLLALHTRIEDMQTSDHAVTILEVKEIMDEAMDHADRKSIGHFLDVLFGRRYDDEDMIILKEKDFI